MPYYVGRAAGDFKDVLDTYYRCGPTPIGPTPPIPSGTDPQCRFNTPGATPSCASTTLTAMPAANWAGYVSNTATHCAWEPSGALYRVVVPVVSQPGLGTFAMTISSQFLVSGTTPTGGATLSWIAPPADYTSQAAVADTPPSPQIGVTVAVFYKTPSGIRSSVTYSQIEQGNPVAPLITSQAKVSTVRVASALDADTNLLEQLGVVNLTGELYSGSRVVTTATAANAGESGGQQINGARVNLVAPIDQPSASDTQGGIGFPTSGCSYQCFDKTAVDQASALASNGLPRAGTSTAPVRAMIPSTAGNGGFQFSNGTADTRLQLKSSEPMVSMDTTGSAPSTMLPVSGCAVQATGVNNARLTGTGFLGATTTSVSSCATAQANVIRLFPTDFAAGGVVRITLTQAIASCSITRPAAGVPNASYQATLSYWNGSGYTTAPTLSSTNTTDPLAGIPLTTVVDTASGLTLGDYVRDWRSATTADIVKKSGPTTAEASISSAVSITTKPTKSAKDTSIVSIDLGAVSCQVGDSR
jgi:hypothetical protein